MDLALRIGELLLSSGAGASDVGAAMQNVARSCGLRNFSADVVFTELTMSHQPAPDVVPVPLIRQVRYRTVDYGDLTLSTTSSATSARAPSTAARPRRG